MANGCTGHDDNETTLAHEVGHYLDLYHTHETYYGDECPDGSNCGSAGDKLCDTPADPKLTGRVYSNCVYDNSAATPAGCSGSYDPMVENHMSYAPPSCRSTFTPLQKEKMLNILLYVRGNLFNYDMTDSDDDGIPDPADNCPNYANADQLDGDMDYWGDDCDDCPNDWFNDADGDGLCAGEDNCPTMSNTDQLDIDGSGIGDICQCTDGVRRFTGANDGDNFGWRIRGAGDVNGDGYPDIIVSSDYSDIGELVNAGKVYVYSGYDGSTLYEIEGDDAYYDFGFSVGGAGDIDNDGFDDMIVGA